MEYPCAEKSVKFGDLTIVVRAQWHRWPNSEPPGGTTEITVTLMRDGMETRIVKTAPFRKTDIPLRCLPHETPRYAEAEAKRAVNVFWRWIGLALIDDVWQLLIELDDAYRFRPIEEVRELSSLEFLTNLRDVGSVVEPLLAVLTHLLCAIHVWRLQTDVEADATSMRVQLGEQLLAFAEQDGVRFADFTPKRSTPMPEVSIQAAMRMKALLHEVWQEFVKHRPTCPRCGAPWAEHGWDHESAYGERISARCENFHEFVIDFDDDFVVQEVTDDDDQASE
jgi:hypothetical protein